MSKEIKLPVWYWIVSAIAILWNLTGIINFAGQAMMTKEMIAMQDDTIRPYFENMTSWAITAFAIAVIAGLVGSIMLLFRRSIAYPIFIISFLGVLVQQSYTVFVSGATISGMMFITPIAVFIFGLALIVMSKGAKDRGWIH